jgi:hypothetical protein
MDGAVDGAVEALEAMSDMNASTEMPLSANQCSLNAFDSAARRLFFGVGAGDAPCGLYLELATGTSSEALAEASGAYLDAVLRRTVATNLSSWKCGVVSPQPGLGLRTLLTSDIEHGSRVGVACKLRCATTSL